MKSYQVYFENRVLLITEKNSANDLYEARIVTDSENLAIEKAIQLVSEKRLPFVILETKNTEECFNRFKRKFLLILAGGGLVKNELGEYLFIFRRGKWDLPKGKLDEGETIEACAIREVREETGLSKVTLLQHLLDTWHVYNEKGKPALKQSVWFQMSCPSGQALTPQAEEDIHEIKWLAKNDWSKIYSNTYPSVKDVLAASS